MPLFITLLITAILIVVIQIGLHKHRKKQKAEYPMLWKQFELSLKKNSHSIRYFFIVQNPNELEFSPKKKHRPLG